MIPAGTVCYLVELADFSHLDGRVVQVVGHEIDAEGNVWHVLDGEWVRETFGERDATALAANLRPIVGPTKRETATINEQRKTPCMRTSTQ
ncbi:MAG: hypothetical protein AB7P31_15175 [Steroidobacteraceae bacterium]